MPPRKQRKGGKAVVGSGPGSAATGDAGGVGGASFQRSPDERLWIALKRSDRKQLAELLFSNTADGTASREDLPSLVARPTAKRLLGQLNHKQQTPLTAALELGLEPDTVLLLLRAGADINARDETSEKSSALHRACLAEDDTMIRILLKNGADVRVKNANGETPLHVLAASSSGADLVRLLLDSICPPMNSVVEQRDESSMQGGRGQDEENDGGKEDDDSEDQVNSGLRDPYVLPGRRTLRMDPLAVLAICDARGATPLHVALSEASYGSTGVASTLLDFLADTLSNAASRASKREAIEKAVRALLAAQGNGGNALHVLLSAPGGDAVAADRVLEKLLALIKATSTAATPATDGLDLFARNAAGSTPLALAVTNFTAARTSDPAYTAVSRLMDHLLAAMAWQRAEIDTWESVFALTDDTNADADSPSSLVHALVLVNNGAAARSLERFCTQKQGSPLSGELPRMVSWLRTLRVKGKRSGLGCEATGQDVLIDLLRDCAAACGRSSGASGRCVGGVSDDLLAALVALGAITAASAKDVKAVCPAMAASASARTPTGVGSDLDEDDDGIVQDNDEHRAAHSAGAAALAVKTAATKAGGNLTRAQRSRRAHTAAIGAGGARGQPRGTGEAGRGGKDASGAEAGRKGVNVPVAIVVALLCIAIVVIAVTPPADGRNGRL